MKKEVLFMKSVLITGASRGIGEAIAYAFAEQGYQIFVNARTDKDGLAHVAQQITNQYHVPCVSFLGNIGDSHFVNALFEQIEKEYKTLDVLVNNAGISHLGLLQDMSDEQWNAVMETNINSLFYTSRAAIPLMLKQQEGRIINISSIWGSCGASMEVAYSASKGAVDSFTKALSKELAPSNISVNAIRCGVIDTSMNGFLDAEERQTLEDEIPAGRFGQTKEVANLAYQIATSSTYMTGQIIGIDGGFL